MLLEPVAGATAELVVRNSRFIAIAEPAATLADAQAVLDRIRTEYVDGSHVVYAFLIGDASSEHAGLSDAGEPKGTAGRPVMEILRGSGVRDVVLAVVRYFGGTKLGTGGLVHAYGNAARAVLEALPTRPRIERITCEVDAGYELVERVRQFVADAHGTMVDEEYATAVRFRFEIPAAERATLEERLRDLSRGAVTLDVVG